MVLWLCMCMCNVHVHVCFMFVLFIYWFHNIFFIDLKFIYMSYQQFILSVTYQLKEPFGIKRSLYFFSSLKIQSHKVQTHHQWFLSSSISVSRIHGYENFIYRMIDTSGLPWDEAIFHAAAAGPGSVERCAAAGRLWSVDTGTGDQQTLGSGSTPPYNKVLLTFNLDITVGGLNSS